MVLVVLVVDWDVEMSMIELRGGAYDGWQKFTKTARLSNAQ